MTDHLMNNTSWDADLARLQELLRGVGANRYWEGRWRDADADNARLRRVNAGLVEAASEVLDIIDQGDMSEVWQTALLKLRLTLRSTTETKGEPT